jgi:hypothetical protein
VTTQLAVEQISNKNGELSMKNTIPITLLLLAGCSEPEAVTQSEIQQSTDVTTPLVNPEPSSVNVLETSSQVAVFQTTADPQRNDKVDIAAVVEVNSRVMDELGRVAELMNGSTDIIMRFNHFTDGHTNRALLCPECSPASGGDEDLEIEEPEEVIPETMVQLLEDAKELHATALRFSSHLILQQVALKSHLAKLRDGKPDRKKQ